MQNSKKRLFTQRELEKHINARLMRERKKNGGLEALRKMIDELIAGGKIDADSYAEAGQRLAQLLAENRKEEDPGNVAAEKIIGGGNMDSGEKNAKAEAKTPYDERMSFRDGVIADMPEYDPEDIDTGIRDSEYGEFSEDIPEADLHKEDNTENGDIGIKLAQLCSGLAELLEKTVSGNSVQKREINTASDIAERRAVSSTGFSSRSASDSFSAGFELTPMQRDIARRAGISYKEYAGLLREIPENIKKRKPYR